MSLYPHYVSVLQGTCGSWFGSSTSLIPDWRSVISDLLIMNYITKRMNICPAQIRCFSLYLHFVDVKRSLFFPPWSKNNERQARWWLVSFRSFLRPVFFSWLKLRELITWSSSTLSGLNAFFSQCVARNKGTLLKLSQKKPLKTFDFPLGWAESDRKTAI